MSILHAPPPLLAFTVSGTFRAPSKPANAIAATLVRKKECIASSLPTTQCPLRHLLFHRGGPVNLTGYNNLPFGGSIATGTADAFKKPERGGRVTVSRDPRASGAALDEDPQGHSSSSLGLDLLHVDLLQNLLLFSQNKGPSGSGGKACKTLMLYGKIDIKSAMGHHRIEMRTTLDVEKDVLNAARTLAAARGTSVGAALSELARRGVSARVPLQMRNGFAVFRLDPGTQTFGPDDVNAALQREDMEGAGAFI